ncbi:MAG: dihydropteroate synthase [Beutenbergiaceae bacterium]
MGTRIMGVVNVTPDSFSDGGLWYDPHIAVAHGRQLLDQGADLIDVGGESTRPGAQRVPEDVEASRVLPVVSELVATGGQVSVDTMRASVAEAALDAGAWGVNDVSGGLADSRMAALVAERGCDVVLGHWRGPSAVMDTLSDYTDVVAQVRSELLSRVEAMTAAGVSPDRIVLDPGLGFAKDERANWQVLARLDALTHTGLRVLVGASRKRFLGTLLAQEGEPALPMYRDAATAAITTLVAAQGVWGVRVHEVSASVDAVRVVAAVRAARTGETGHAGYLDHGR